MSVKPGVSFLTHLFTSRTEAPVFLASYANDKANTHIKPRQLITRDLKPIEQFIEQWDQKDRAIYFCVSTIKTGKQQRSKETLAELTGLHSDIDFKGVDATPAEVEKTLRQLQLPPSCINFSGHGYHAYWLFREALAATPENIARVEAALRRLANHLAGDPSVCEVARLMRLPGTHNSKNGEWIEVTTVTERPSGYELEELEEWLADAVPALRRRATPNGNGQSHDNPFETLGAEQTIKPAIDVEQRLAAMIFQGAGDAGIHQTQLAVSAALINRGVPIDEVVTKLLEATRVAAGGSGGQWNWRREETDIRDMCETWLVKHPVTVEVEAPVPEAPAAPEAIATAAEPDADTPKADEQGLAGVSLADFHAYMPLHSYIFAPSREMWPASSVNARVRPLPVVGADGKPALGKKGEPKTTTATGWLDRHKPVEQMTWAPGLPMLIRNRLISEGGWIERNKVTCFNLYRPPTIKLGDATQATPWLDHIRKIFGDDADHVVLWLAHRVQRPHEKINHALVLGGGQGIGKDTLLEPVKRAVGPWNFTEVSPPQMMGRFNGFLKSVILRINEARDLGDVNRYQFYDHMKAYTAAPPDVLRCDEKHLREHHVLNCCGVILTTNHKADGIYLPPDDRRHFVAWSEFTKEDFTREYWNTLWGWYATGGDRHVAAYLAGLDIAALFDPKAPPPKTPAFWDIVDASRAPEEGELADALDKLGNPDATTLIRITNEATGDFEEWIRDRKNRRAIPHRLEKCGYVPVRNDTSEKGLWVINGTRQVVYAKATLTLADRLRAARALTRGLPNATPRLD